MSQSQVIWEGEAFGAPHRAVYFPHFSTGDDIFDCKVVVERQAHTPSDATGTRSPYWTRESVNQHQEKTCLHLCIAALLERAR